MKQISVSFFGRKTFCLLFRHFAAPRGEVSLWVTRQISTKVIKSPTLSKLSTKNECVGHLGIFIPIQTRHLALFGISGLNLETPLFVANFNEFYPCFYLSSEIWTPTNQPRSNPLMRFELLVIYQNASFLTISLVLIGSIVCYYFSSLARERKKERKRGKQLSVSPLHPIRSSTVSLESFSLSANSSTLILLCHKVLGC